MKDKESQIVHVKRNAIRNLYCCYRCTFKVSNTTIQTIVSYDRTSISNES